MVSEKSGKSQGILLSIICGNPVRVCNRKIFFLFLNQNICCWYSEELSQREGPFEHPKHMFKLVGKKMFTLTLKNCVYLNLLKMHCCCNSAQ